MTLGCSRARAHGASWRRVSPAGRVVALFGRAPGPGGAAGQATGIPRPALLLAHAGGPQASPGGDEERGPRPAGVALSHGPSGELTHLGTARAGVPCQPGLPAQPSPVAAQPAAARALCSRTPACGGGAGDRLRPSRKAVPPRLSPEAARAGAGGGAPGARRMPGSLRPRVTVGPRSHPKMTQGCFRPAVQVRAVAVKVVGLGPRLLTGDVKCCPDERAHSLSKCVALTNCSRLCTPLRQMVLLTPFQGEGTEAQEAGEGPGRAGM